MPAKKRGGKRRGTGFWDDFKHGFSLPFKGIGELGSAALGGLLGDGAKKPVLKGGMGMLARHKAEDRMNRGRRGKGFNGEDYIMKSRHDIGFPPDYHKEYAVKYNQYASSPSVGLVKF